MRYKIAGAVAFSTQFLPVFRRGIFVQKLSADGFTATTILQHLVATRKVLTHAQTQSLIVSVPKAPAIKVTSKPRGSFTVTEYRQLVQTAKRLQGQRISIKTSIGSNAWPRPGRSLCSGQQ